MPTNPWEQMNLDERIDWLRNRVLTLTDFINNAALPQLEGRLAQLATRITALENRSTDSAGVEPK
jgi:hypothetical protein